MTAKALSGACRWVSVLALFAVVVAGAWTWTRQGEGSRTPQLRPLGADRAAAIEAQPSPSGDAGANGAGAGAGAGLGGATRTIETASLLATPLDPAEMRELARLGRARFVGLVLALDGTPCANAPLFVNGNPSTVSDSGGAYAIEVQHAVVHGLFLLSARIDGVGVAVEGVRGPARRLDLQLVAGGSIVGRAIGWRSRLPISDAEVELRVDAGGLWPGRGDEIVRAPSILTTRTATDGTFRFDQLPPLVDVGVRAQTASDDNVIFRGFPGPGNGEERVVTLELRRRIAVRGWFSPWPPHGVPAGAELRVVAHADRAVAAIPAADGRFELSLAEFSHWTLMLEAGGVRLASLVLPIPPDSPPIDLGRIDLAEPSTIVGQLDGFPALAEYGLKLRADCRGGEQEEVKAAVYEVPVGSDGRFTIGPCVMEECQIQIAVADISVSLQEARHLVARGKTLDIGIVRFNGTLVGGRVVDEQGAPIATAVAGCDDELQRVGHFFRRNASVDSAGRFLIVVFGEPGDAKVLRARATGIGPRAVPFTLGSGIQSIGAIVIGTGRRLGGRLLSAEGAPWVAARITLTAEGTEEIETVSGADGSSEFLGLEPCAYSATVESPEFAQFAPPPVAPDVNDVTWISPD